MPARVPATRRARAAEVLRQDGSYSEAARAAKVSRRTVINWSHEPAFQALLRNEPLRTLGHIAVAEDAPDQSEPQAPSRAWVDARTATIIGSEINPLADPTLTSGRDEDSGKPGALTPEVVASVVQVELVHSARRATHVAEALAVGNLPRPAPRARVIPCTLAGLLHVQRDPHDLALLIRAADDFRAFLSVWAFLDQDAGVERVLGASLWSAQEEFVRAAQASSWLFALKSRQVGLTTISCAFDAFVLRFTPSARVHLFSRRDDEAVEVLERVNYGLDRLPEWMQLPLVRVTGHRREYAAGQSDVRVLKAYPSDAATSRGATCSHSHVDEWAVMSDPRNVWRSIEPGLAGSCHVVTTSLGPENFAGQFWMRVMEGEVLDHAGRPMRPCFIGALSRPDRNEAWLEGKRRSTDPSHFKLEYPLTWEDALAGGGETFFDPADVRQALVDARPPCPAQLNHRYVKSWDIGTKDATVGVVLDITGGEIHDVVAFVRLKGTTYRHIAVEIERVHRSYPGLTVVEDNAAGLAVREFLNLSEHECVGFKTTASSKGSGLAGLALALQMQTLKWPAEFAQLTNEMLAYRLPDDSIVQDSVLALMIAQASAARAYASQGRVVAVIRV